MDQLEAAHGNAAMEGLGINEKVLALLIARKMK